MAYDPIIDFYDEPGGPYWPNKNGDSGGGGGSLGELQSVYFDKFNAEQFSDSLSFYLSLQDFDVSGSNAEVIEANIRENANLEHGAKYDNSGMAGYAVSSGMYVCAIAVSLSTAYDPSSLKVYVNPDEDPQLVTDGYECNVMTSSIGNYYVYVTAQVPANGIRFEF